MACIQRGGSAQPIADAVTEKLQPVQTVSIGQRAVNELFRRTGSVLGREIDIGRPCANHGQ